MITVKELEKAIAHNKKAYEIVKDNFTRDMNYIVDSIGDTTDIENIVAYANDIRENADLYTSDLKDIAMMISDCNLTLNDLINDEINRAEWYSEKTLKDYIIDIEKLYTYISVSDRQALSDMLNA